MVGHATGILIVHVELEGGLLSFYVPPRSLYFIQSYSASARFV